MRRSLLLAGLVSMSSSAHAAGDTDYPAWYADPVTQTAFAALLVFLLIVWRLGGFKAMFSALDSRSEGIRSQIEEAQALREEAAKLMAEAEKRAREADLEAQGIVKRAKADAKALMKDARAELDAKLARRAAQAEQRIARAEADAAKAVQQAAADAATEAARVILSQPARSKGLFDRALADIKDRLN